jgi:hypothetical protein
MRASRRLCLGTTSLAPRWSPTQHPAGSVPRISLSSKPHDQRLRRCLPLLLPLLSHIFPGVVSIMLRIVHMPRGSGQECSRSFCALPARSYTGPSPRDVTFREGGEPDYHGQCSRMNVRHGHAGALSLSSLHSPCRRRVIRPRLEPSSLFIVRIPAVHSHARRSSCTWSV